jgi:septal ring factor EnvC (AmiA/AmiB activator)
MKITDDHRDNSQQLLKSLHPAGFPDTQVTKMPKDDPNSSTPQQHSHDDLGITADRNQLKFGKLAAIKTECQDLARTIRLADSCMEAIDRNLEEMKDRLKGLLKQFPPFPLDSDERIQRLKTINTIRKQIEQMTFPALKPSSEDAIGKSKEIQEFQEVTIPELEITASETVLHAALKSYTAAQKTNKENRDLLVQLFNTPSPALSQ